MAMKVRIRDLDFEALIARVANAVDPVQRRGCDAIMTDQLERTRSPEKAVTGFRGTVLVALTDTTKTVEDLRADDPVVHAFVRIQHHPLAPPLYPVKVRRLIDGPIATPWLNAVADAHPELTWDPDEAQALLLRAILEKNGDHLLEDSEPPWLMHWDASSAIWDSLMVLVSLRALGDL
jgi:hypothetical protein